MCRADAATRGRSILLRCRQFVLLVARGPFHCRLRAHHARHQRAPFNLQYYADGGVGCGGALSPTHADERGRSTIWRTAAPRRAASKSGPRPARRRRPPAPRLSSPAPISRRAASSGMHVFGPWKCRPAELGRSSSVGVSESPGPSRRPPRQRLRSRELRSPFPSVIYCSTVITFLLMLRRAAFPIAIESNERRETPVCRRGQ